MVFKYTSPTEVVLPIEASVRERAEQQSAGFLEAARWTAYLNAVCLETVLPWLQEEYATPAEVWLADELPALWSLVTGTAIALGHKRIVLIPTQEFATTPLVVPQEWIDLPDWAGDYFLPVQVDPIEHWLRIGGYTTHLHLKNEGEYHAGDRTYRMDSTQIVSDMTALAVVYQLNPQEQTQARIQPLRTLSDTQIEALLEHLSCSTIASPSQFFSLESWGQMLQNAATRSRLYRICAVAATTAGAAQWAQPQFPVNLMNWLQQQFEAVWEAIDTVFPADSRLAFSLRHKTSESSADIYRARSIRLTDGYSITLVVILEPEWSEDESVEAPLPQIQIRLYPGDRTFPENLTLSLLSSQGEVVQQVEAKEEADFIQLKRFRFRPDRTFIVQITTAASVFKEQFMG